MSIYIETKFSWVPFTRKYMECFTEVFLSVRQCIAALLLCMGFPEMKRSVWCGQRTSMNLHNIDLAALGPLSIKTFICRHHPEGRQKTFSAWNLRPYLKPPILEIMLLLCIDSSWCVVRLPVNHFLDCLNIQHTILYISIPLRVHISLQFRIYPAWLMILEIPIIKIEFFSIKIIFPYKLIHWILWLIWLIWSSPVWWKLRNLSKIFYSTAAAYLFFAPHCTLCCTYLHFPFSKIMSQRRCFLLFLSITFRTCVCHKTAFRTCRFFVILLCALPIMCCTVRNKHMADWSYAVCFHLDICLSIIFGSDNTLLHSDSLRVCRRIFHRLTCSSDLNAKCALLSFV